MCCHRTLFIKPAGSHAGSTSTASPPASTDSSMRDPRARSATATGRPDAA
ncbi:hypothetical protein ACMHYB_62225 [Sorangium sp. So ce1128]